MFLDIPALDFIRDLSGIYKDDQAELRIVCCGYGFALELSDKKLIFTGVIGVCKGSIECYALLGMPNTFRFEGELISKDTLQLKGDEPLFRVDIAKQQDAIRFEIYLQEQLKKSFTLQKVHE